MAVPRPPFHEPHERYRQIVEAHTDPICRFVPDGTLTFVNDAYCAYFDKSEAEALSSSFFHLMSAAQRLEILAQLSAISPAGPIFDYEHKITLAPGEFRWIKWTVRGLFDEQGAMLEVQAVARDITARKLAEMATMKSQARYSNLIRAIPDGVVAYDPDGRVTYVNDGFINLYGWSREELLGRSIDFVPLEEQQRTLDAWQRTFQGEPVLFETKRRTRDGKLLDIQLRTAILLDRHGNVTESIVIHRDITERKKSEKALQRAHDELEHRVRERTAELSESEERFRAVFETAQDCIFLKDRDLVYTHVNPAFLKALDLPESTVIGKPGEQIFEASESSYIRDLEHRVLGGQVVEATYNLTTNGSTKTFHCIRVPMSNASGDTIGVCGIARDVTDRKALERRCPRAEARYRSRLMEATREQIRLAAQSESIVLLLGESGSGKDYLAKYLHEHSRRAGGPFFAINCAALASSVAESELFGHEAGSFTGARGRKRGLLEMAEGGTLLLNEIGELSQELQAKLLTFLDTQSFTRVGGEKMVQVNARIVGATNRKLDKELEAGRFREDLYYRLNVFNIRVPSLRERKEDIPFLAEDILESLSAKLGRSSPPILAEPALEALIAYHWPGNVRELRNVLERALILCRGHSIRAEDLNIPNASADDEGGEKEIGVSLSVSAQQTLNDALESAKRSIIVSALGRCSGNVSAAARLLGISRDALRHHLKMLHLDRCQSPQGQTAELGEIHPV